VGFPVVVAGFLLLRLDPTLRELSATLREIRGALLVVGVLHPEKER
jgi:hypothetical protein